MKRLNDTDGSTLPTSVPPVGLSVSLSRERGERWVAEPGQREAAGQGRATHPAHPSGDWKQGRPRVSHCLRGHPRTPENTYHRAGKGSQCLECMRERDKQRRNERPAKIVVVNCPECGCGRTMTDRNAARIARGEQTGLCGICRTGPEIHVTDELKLWWLDRYTLDEIHVLASMLLPFDTERKAA